MMKYYRWSASALIAARRARRRRKIRRVAVTVAICAAGVAVLYGIYCLTIAILTALATPC